MTSPQTFAAEQWERVRRDFTRSFLIDTPIAQLAKDVATSWPFREENETPRKYIGMTWEQLCKCPGLSSHRARCFKLLRILDETLAFDESFSLLAEDEPVAAKPTEPEAFEAESSTLASERVVEESPATEAVFEDAAETAIATLPAPQEAFVPEEEASSAPAEDELEPLLFYHDPALFDPVSPPEAFTAPPPVSRHVPSSHRRVQVFEAALRHSRVLEIARVELESHLVYPRFRENGRELSHCPV